MRALALLAALLCVTACSAAPAYPPPTPLSIERAVAILEEATVVAGHTATSQSDRETATVVRQANLESSQAAVTGTYAGLRVEQTQSALAITRAAADLSLAQERDAATHNAMQTAVWATPTWQALQTQAVAHQAAADLRAERAASTAEFWRNLRYVVLGLVGVGGVVALLGALIGGIVWVWVSVIKERARIAVAALQAKAAIAKEAFRLMPGYWAEYRDPEEGYQVYPLPRIEVVETTPPVPELEAPAAADSANFDQAWRLAFRVLAWAGERYGWSHSVLAGAASPHRVISEPGWRKMTRMLRDAGWLVGGNEGTHWAEGKGYAPFVEALNSRALILPYPKCPPPTVSAGGERHTTTPHAATPHATPRRSPIPN